MSEDKMYSPVQAALGAFLGGPIASTYFISKNYDTMNNDNASKQSLVIGSIIVFALLGILPFLPDNFPNLVIPIMTIVATRLIIEKNQLTKEKIEEDDTLSFHSNWLVFGIGLASLFVMYVAITVVIALLEL